MLARVKLIQYNDVPPTGAITEHDVIDPNGEILRSPPDGGCGAPNCSCFQGHFFQRLLPRDEQGTVFGYNVEFDSHEEMAELTELELARIAQRAMH